MSKTITHKVHRNKNYTIISNGFLKDSNLSLKSKGLLTMMFSFPDDWDFSIEGIVSISKEGRDSVRSAIRELIGQGYCIRRQIKGSDGRIEKMEYNFYETPQVTKP